MSYLKFVSVIPLPYHRKVHTKVNTCGTEKFSNFLNVKWTFAIIWHLLWVIHPSVNFSYYLYLEIHSEGWWWNKLYDKRDNFNFPIVNFPFICSNIPAAPACGVYISQIIWYSRACGSYQDFLDRGLLLTRKLLNQGFLLVKLKSSLWKFYCRHHDFVNRYRICHKWPRICSICLKHFPVLSSFMTYNGVCY